MSEREQMTTVCLDKNPLPPQPDENSLDQDTSSALPQHAVIDYCTSKCLADCALKPLSTED